MKRVAATHESARELAQTFEAEHAAVVESRGPAPIKPKGKGRSRPVIVTDAEGNPKRIVTHDRLLEGLLEREGVEAVVEGKRPRVVRCIECGEPIPVSPRPGKIPSYCKSPDGGCRKLRQRLKIKAAHDRMKAADPEGVRRRQAESRARNIEKRRVANRERCRKRRLANPEATRAAAQKSKAKPGARERYAATEAARRARKKADREAAKRASTA